MARQIYRQEALDRLASPDRLDQLMPLTSPRGWIALAACGLLLAMAFVWGLFGSIAITVDGQGVLTRDGGVTVVAAPSDGMFTRVSVQPGAVVESGQALAWLAGTGEDGGGEEIKSPVAGRVLDVPARPREAVKKGATLFRLESLQDRLRALVFVPVDDGFRVEADMPARVFLGGEKSYTATALHGKVARASRYPVTRASVVQAVQDEDWANALLRNGPCVEFEVAMDPGGEGAFEPYSGTPCRVEITVERRRPIQLALPFVGRH